MLKLLSTGVNYLLSRPTGGEGDDVGAATDLMGLHLVQPEICNFANLRTLFTDKC